MATPFSNLTPKTTPTQSTANVPASFGNVTAGQSAPAVSILPTASSTSITSVGNILPADKPTTAADYISLSNTELSSTVVVSPVTGVVVPTAVTDTTISPPENIRVTASSNNVGKVTLECLWDWDTQKQHTFQPAYTITYSINNIQIVNNVATIGTSYTLQTPNENDVYSITVIAKNPTSGLTKSASFTYTYKTTTAAIVPSVPTVSTIPFPPTNVVVEGSTDLQWYSQDIVITLNKNPANAAANIIIVGYFVEVYAPNTGLVDSFVVPVISEGGINIGGASFTYSASQIFSNFRNYSRTVTFKIYSKDATGNISDSIEAICTNNAPAKITGITSNISGNLVSLNIGSYVFSQEAENIIIAVTSLANTIPTKDTWFTKIPCNNVTSGVSFLLPLAGSYYIKVAVSDVYCEEFLNWSAEFRITIAKNYNTPTYNATDAEINTLVGISTTSTLATQLGAFEKTSNKNVANGYVGLDANNKIPVTYIPSASADWSTITNKPALQASNAILSAISTLVLTPNIMGKIAIVYNNATNTYTASSDTTTYASSASLTAHTGSATIHLSTEQNAFLDYILPETTPVPTGRFTNGTTLGSYFANLTGNIQAQLDAKASSAASVNLAIATDTPKNLAAVAVVGTSTNAARADHVHKFPTLADLGFTGNNKPVSVITTAEPTGGTDGDFAFNAADKNLFQKVGTDWIYVNKGSAAIVGADTENAVIYNKTITKSFSTGAYYSYISFMVRPGTKTLKSFRVVIKNNDNSSATYTFLHTAGTTSYSNGQIAGVSSIYGGYNRYIISFEVTPIYSIETAPATNGSSSGINPVYPNGGAPKLTVNVTGTSVTIDWSITPVPTATNVRVYVYYKLTSTGNFLNFSSTNTTTNSWYAPYPTSGNPFLQLSGT